MTHDGDDGEYRVQNDGDDGEYKVQNSAWQTFYALSFFLTGVYAAFGHWTLVHVA